jgi:hypothetical protein
MNSWIRLLADKARLPESRNFVVPWDIVERELGTGLPNDYKEFIGYFGPGVLGGLLRVHAPGIQNPNYEFRAFAHATLEELVEEPDEDTPAIFPAVGGLLPWGSTTDSDVLYWVTEGTPDTWEVVAEEGTGSVRQRFNGGLSEFVFRYLSAEISVESLPRIRSSGAGIKFEPWGVDWDDDDRLIAISHFEVG